MRVLRTTWRDQLLLTSEEVDADDLPPMITTILFMGPESAYVDCLTISRANGTRRVYQPIR